MRLGLETLVVNTRERLQKCQELYASEPSKIDKTVYSTDELQAYAIYKPALDTYNTKVQKKKQLKNIVKILKY